MPKTAVGYGRFSSDMQREESIQAQKRAIDDYCQRNDIQLIEFYEDQGISGTTDERPGFQAMIQAASDVDFVVVHKLDRFARNRYDSAIYRKHLESTGTRLLSVLENFDDSPESILLESLLTGMSEYFSKNLAREVYKGMRENAMKAKFNGGTPPLGYSIDSEGFYQINEAEAAIVRIIFNRFLEGYSYVQIAGYLNEKGYTNKHGKPFNRNSFTEMLKNEKYKGTYVFGFNDSHGPRRSSRKKNPDDRIIRIENGVPAIIPEEIFDQVNELRKKRSGSAMRTGCRPYLLTGLMQCSQCGAPMVGVSRRNKSRQQYHYYWCNDRCGAKSIRADILEEQIIDIFKKVLLNEHNLKVIAQATYQKALESIDSSATNQIDKRLKDIDKQIKNTVDLMAKTGSEALIDKLEALESEKQALEFEKKRSQATTLSLEKIEREIFSFLQFEDALPAEQRELLSIFIEKIKADRENVSISIRYIPRSMIECVYEDGAGNALHPEYTLKIEFRAA